MKFMNRVKVLLIEPKCEHIEDVTELITKILTRIYMSKRKRGNKMKVAVSDRIMSIIRDLKSGVSLRDSCAKHDCNPDDLSYYDLIIIANSVA